MRELLNRRLVPWAIVLLSQVRWPGRVVAAARRSLGRQGRVELSFAFDDPYSAVALLGLRERVARRRVQLALAPVVERGMANDPAVDRKRRHAIEDARRLGRRAGLELSRTEPLAAHETAFLAAWVASAPGAPGVAAFCADALHRLWFSSDGPVATAEYGALWREHVGAEPPDGADPRLAERVRRIERRVRRRGPYDTPAARVHGQWFFAHERLAQIEERLDELGWTVAP